MTIPLKVHFFMHIIYFVMRLLFRYTHPNTDRAQHCLTLLFFFILAKYKGRQILKNLNIATKSLSCSFIFPKCFLRYFINSDQKQEVIMSD
jgi:hypothetical protein